MSDVVEVWEAEMSALWSAVRSGHLPDEDILEQVDSLADRCPLTDGTADFERAGARDTTGDPVAAVGLYRAALEQGLVGPRRRECAIQLASSLRNLGAHDDAIELLETERARLSDSYDDAIAGFLALALASAGRDREAAGVALTALAPHVPRYQRALAAYAEDLLPAEH